MVFMSFALYLYPDPEMRTRALVVRVGEKFDSRLVMRPSTRDLYNAGAENEEMLLIDR